MEGAARRRKLQFGGLAKQRDPVCQRTRDGGRCRADLRCARQWRFSRWSACGRYEGVGAIPRGAASIVLAGGSAEAAHGCWFHAQHHPQSRDWSASPIVRPLGRRRIAGVLRPDRPNRLLLHDQSDAERYRDGNSPNRPLSTRCSTEVFPWTWRPMLARLASKWRKRISTRRGTVLFMSGSGWAGWRPRSTPQTFHRNRAQPLKKPVVRKSLTERGGLLVIFMRRVV
jgi:hypothetical protein